MSVSSMSSKSSESSGGVRQVGPPRKRQKQENVREYWSFRFTSSKVPSSEHLKQLLENNFQAFRFQLEAGDGGQAHFQGVFHTKPKKRREQLRAFFSQRYVELQFPHLDYLEASESAAADRYVMKEESRLAGPWEFNMPAEKKKSRPLVKMTYEMLNNDQRRIADMFAEPEDPLWGRKIYWFWEPNGNWGKSVLATYLIDQRNAIEVSGAAKDCFCGIANQLEKHDIEIVIFDIPRSCVDYVSFQAIEKIKDGKFFSAKYESGMVRFNRPHIICFANSPPPEEKLSLDRWEVTELV